MSSFHKEEWTVVKTTLSGGKIFIGYTDEEGNSVKDFPLPIFLLSDKDIKEDDIRAGSKLEVVSYEQLDSGRIKRAFEIDKIRLLK